MSLLDIFNTDAGRQALGLMAAGGPVTDPNQTGYGQRMQSAVGSFDAWKQKKIENEQNAMKFQILQARQMQEMQEAQQLQQARETQAKENARIQAIVAGAGRVSSPMMGDASGYTPAGVSPVLGNTQGDTPAGVALGKIDFQDLFRQGVPFKTLESLAATQNLGREEVARVQEIEGPNGTKLLQGFTKFGDRAGQGEMGYLAPQLVNQGDRQTFVKPSAGMSLPTFQDANSKASNALGWANFGLSRERMSMDRQKGEESAKPKYVDGQWVVAPNDMKPGETRAAMQPVAIKDAREALNLIQTARQIIPKSTGSYMGAGVDQAARVFGASTGGDTAAAQLKALEGALVSKMPKMSGPQSDKDVLLYKQMAGEIGDPTIPQSRKLAALQVIEEIQARNAGAPAVNTGGATGDFGKAMDKMPTANASNKGRTIRDTETGEILKSNGMSWVEAK